VNRIQKKTALHVRLDFLIGLFLAIIILAVYWQVRNHEFVHYDDSVYVTDNLQVQSGISAANIRWAFTFADKEGNYWQPLTWLSHMLDCELYGLRPGGHHLTSLIFHTLNTLLLFLVLHRMTGAFWESVLVAALFSLHPINVESVAWVAARKNVLSTLFWLLSMAAYVFYTARPGLARYLLTLLVLTAGLMAKPMLATLPFVFLLLDYWPLGRLRLGPLVGSGSGNPRRVNIFGYHALPEFCLLLEKVPMLVLSFASIHITLLSLQPYGNVIPTKFMPMSLRFSNALVSYAGYVGKMIWPQNLAALYPYPGELPVWQTAGAGMFVICASVLVLRTCRPRPYLLVGWFWYLGTLVPAIGLVQGGVWPKMADRFAYVPFIGLFIIIAWGVPDILSARRHKKVLMAIAAGIVLPALMVCSWFQIGRWQNSITLFKHAIEVTDKNWLAHTNLGRAFFDQGRLDAAIDHFHKALAIKPNSVPALYNLGKALSDSGNIDRAAWFYQKTLEIKPDYTGAHNNLGNILANRGDFENAEWHYQEVLRTNPEHVDAHNNLANVLAAQGKLDEAVRLYTEAIRISPGYANAHYNFGNLLLKMDLEKFNQAAAYFFEMVENRSEYAPALHQVGAVLARQGRISKASVFFSKATQINPDYGPVRQDLENMHKALFSGEK